MPSAKDLTPDSRFVGLFVGRSGSGKKAAACSFPKPIKYFDFDLRIRGLLGCPWVSREGIDYVSIPPIPPPGKSIYQIINDELSVLLTMVRSNQCPYKTVVVGSITGETLALLNDAIPLTHADNKGRSMGVLNLAGPEDYKFQSTGTHQVLSFLRSLPLNIIVTGHVVQRWGKPPGEAPEGKMDVRENIVLGERLSLTDKLSENVPNYFDNIVRFEKIDTGNRVQFYASFEGELARNTLGITYGDNDFTKKNFYDTFIKPITERTASDQSPKP